MPQAFLGKARARCKGFHAYATALKRFSLNNNIKHIEIEACVSECGQNSRTGLMLFASAFTCTLRLCRAAARFDAAALGRFGQRGGSDSLPIGGGVADAVMQDKRIVIGYTEPAEVGVFSEFRSIE